MIVEIKKQTTNIDEQGNVLYLDQDRLDRKEVGFPPYKNKPNGLGIYNWLLEHVIYMSRDRWPLALKLYRMFVKFSVWMKEGGWKARVYKTGIKLYPDMERPTGTVVMPLDVDLTGQGEKVVVPMELIKESLKSISKGAFSGCTALESLTLPDSLTKITGVSYSYEKGAFANCAALKSVKLGSGLVTIGNGYNNSDGGYAETGVFGNCGNLETVEFGPNLETIGHHAFSECGHLKSLTIPDSVTTIGVNCFYNNIRLTKVTFGADLQSIGACAFMGCVSLSSVSFSPATTPLLTINANAFANCKYLASLTLSNAMPTIKSGAFEGCTMLRRITVPSLMSTIESNVFSGMENLNEVIFLGLPPENLANAGLATDIKIRYPEEYKEDWEAVVETIGFTNASVYEQKELPILTDDSRYGLSDKPSDRAIASITVNQNNSPLNEFVMEDGKVFDCIIRIVNTAANDVTVTLPAGYVYESFKNATPLTIPANSRNILTITRTSDTTFLVTREELAVLQQ